ncbi:MDR family oxidoreductase [Thalassobaculum sp. OXR-137]|uniref:MDR family oxidoreductase n=1 Tax=Thalassobaculum sp. OXR-137 TaxID=3100173 RepID=UPI002AC98F53|nr:MDR family oxidoreductase [Thalassobaculum sp. OXR-137]WPZ34681.1 MDR family oxidoreductase [Thalassobaculum sp. OXR-137]
MTDTFKAYLLREGDDRKVTGAFEDVAMSDLPEGDVTVRVAYSTVNYKDGMVMNGIGRLVRSYPHVPGVDFSGVVETSDNPGFKPGDKVVLTGWRVGEMHWGGYGELARVKGDWLVKLPDGLSLSRAMALGTAGFTAGLAVDTLETAGMDPSKGEVLVTGAAGGVGSVAVALLAAKGYSVVAATGRAETHDYLTDLGAASFIDRAELAEQPSRPLNKERFQAAIDNVAGPTLANLLTQIAYGGSVAAVGLAGGNDVSTTVLPFLLRGVNLLGIDSVMCPAERRRKVWSMIAGTLPMEKLDAISHSHGFDELPVLGKAILKGEVRGRAVVTVGGE